MLPHDKFNVLGTSGAYHVVEDCEGGPTNATTRKCGVPCTPVPDTFAARHRPPAKREGIFHFGKYDVNLPSCDQTRPHCIFVLKVQAAQKNE